MLACTGTTQPLSDEDISLRREGLARTTEAPAPVYAGKEPGENKVYTRAFHDAPPMVPHSVADMELTAGANDCLDCHEEGDEDTPGLPPSHRIKAKAEILSRAAVRSGQVTRISSFVKVRVVAGNRYDCRLCHAPQAENAPNLVDNIFAAVELEDSRKDILDNLNEGGKF